jgi:hypothetical protein
LKHAADQGSVKAQYRYSCPLVKRDGISMDQSKGECSVRLGTDQGDAQAQVDYRVLLLNR